MRPGALRHYVTFYSDTSGDETIDPTWTAVAHLTDWPSNVVAESGQEGYGRSDSQLEATTSYLITTRYSADITPRLQIVDHLGRTHVIKSVIDVEGRERQIEIRTTGVN